MILQKITKFPGLGLRLFSNFQIIPCQFLTSIFINFPNVHNNHGKNAHSQLVSKVFMYEAGMCKMDCDVLVPLLPTTQSHKIEKVAQQRLQLMTSFFGINDPDKTNGMTGLLRCTKRNYSIIN